MTSNFGRWVSCCSPAARSVIISGIRWTYATGLTGPAGLTSGPGGYTLVLDASANSGIIAAPTFDVWINGFDWSGFSSPDLTLSGDPDGDGIASGVENSFGTAPRSFSQGLMAGEKNGNQFTFTHRVNATPASDLTAAYRWSKDLAAFHAEGTTHEGTTVNFAPCTPSGGMVTVTATVTGIALDRLFVDVKVTPN